MRKYLLLPVILLAVACAPKGPPAAAGGPFPLLFL